MPKLNLPLKIALLETGKKQYRIARLLKMSDAALSAYVRGHRTPNEAQRKRLADFLGRDVAEIFPDHAA